MTDAPLAPRDSMEFDVVIVGAGPAGLGAAIRLKQINPDLTIVVVEKGSEVGAHILSGAVIDPVALDNLLPDWRDDPDCPLRTRVADDRFYWLTASAAIRLPSFLMPPLMSNHHCYIGSLGDLCRWLAPQAEALGVEIYPASPRPRSSTARTATCVASLPATWAWRAMARTNPRSRAAWNCSASTRCSRRARGAV